MWPFNKGRPLNGGPLNRGSTVYVYLSCVSWLFMSKLSSYKSVESFSNHLEQLECSLFVIHVDWN